jgi:hypothetical protein
MLDVAAVQDRLADMRAADGDATLAEFVATLVGNGRAWDVVERELAPFIPPPFLAPFVDWCPPPLCLTGRGFKTKSPPRPRPKRASKSRRPTPRAPPSAAPPPTSPPPSWRAETTPSAR